MDAPSPWHAGERAIQARVGVADRMAAVGRQVLRPFMPDQHRVFFAQLPFLLVGSIDAAGRPWASLLAGPPGFVASPTPQRLDIAARPDAGDPLAAVLAPGARLGLLGIELPTRRRNRMNGPVIALDDRGFSVAVEQSFGNCPKYIHARDYLGWRMPGPVRAEPMAALDGEARRLIDGAATLFVASAADGAVDVSHRGGQPGFLGIEADGAIVVPDYAGNKFFNTLGNLLADPRAGLLVPDFATGDLLQVTGRTGIEWDGPAVAALPGAERLWRFRPEHGQWLRGGMPLRFTAGEPSPVAPDVAA